MMQTGIIISVCILLDRICDVNGWALSQSTSTAWTTRPLLHLTRHRPQLVSLTCLYMGLRGKKIRREKRKAKQEPTPPRIVTPYGPIRISKPPSLCYQCRGRGMCRCSVCEGRGVVRATGHRKRNSFNVDRLVHSQWSSVEVYNGHRHHTIVETSGSKKRGTLEIRMRNCCGPQEDFWIPEEELRDKRVWRMGWLTLEDILRAKERNGGALIDVKVCFRCKGQRILVCVDCDGKGEIPNYEPLHEL